MTEYNPLDKSSLIDRFDRILEWIKSCDTKSSIVLTGIGIFVAVFTSEHSINMLKLILSQTFQNINFSNLLYLVIFIISWIVFTYGSYCLIRVLIPRLSKDVQAYEGTYKDSIYYFESISKNTYKEFEEKIMNRGQDEDIKDILSQIYVNSKICTNKYYYYNKGIKFSFIGVAGVIVLYVVGIILVKLGGF